MYIDYQFWKYYATMENTGCVRCVYHMDTLSYTGEIRIGPINTKCSPVFYPA